jgi:hypothetical protein
MVTMDDEAVASSLAMLGRLDEAGMDQRLARFRGRLRELRDDPAEAARIDALVVDAEREEQDRDSASGNGPAIYVNGGVVNVSHGDGQTVTVREDNGERLAALELELTQLRRDLEEVLSRTRPQRAESTRDEAPSRSRPRRTWEAVLAPAFGNGVLVAILAAATVATALHAAAVALTVIASVLAMTTAAATFLAAWMPWTSIRALNRRGDAHIALELLSRGGGASRFPARASDDEVSPGTPAGKSGRAAVMDPPSRESRVLARKMVTKPCTCPSCGERLEVGDAFCGGCGAPPPLFAVG